MLGDVLAHGVALASLRRPFGVVLVGRAILVEDRSSLDLVDVGLRDDRGDAGRDDYPLDGAGVVDALDDVVADPPNVFVIVVVAHMRNVADAVAAREDLVAAHVTVEIS